MMQAQTLRADMRFRILEEILGPAVTKIARESKDGTFLNIWLKNGGNGYFIETRPEVNLKGHYTIEITKAEKEPKVYYLINRDSVPLEVDARTRHKVLLGLDAGLRGDHTEHLLRKTDPGRGGICYIPPE